VRCCAKDRCTTERRYCHTKNTAASKPVSHRAAEQQQRTQRQKIGVDHPLQRARIGVQRIADDRETDIHDRTVDEGEARCEDGCRENEARIFRTAARRHTPCGGSIALRANSEIQARPFAK
jgi:hypothetical protein